MYPPIRKMCYIEFVEIFVPEDTQRIFLIDDDFLHRLSWSNLLGNHCFTAFETVAAFVEHFTRHSRQGNEIVFMDYELNDGIPPSQNAKQIFALGFPTVFIATSHAPEVLEPIDGISGVISKRPPDWLLDIADKNRIDPRFIKLSIQERRDLTYLMSDKDKARLTKRLKVFQETVFENPIAELEMDTWERAIFENVSDEEILLRRDASRPQLSTN